MCNQTCRVSCVNGMCSKEFECECFIGWAGIACEIDCECNNHSFCTINGPGSCDECQDFTTG